MSQTAPTATAVDDAMQDALQDVVRTIGEIKDTLDRIARALESTATAD